MPEHQGKSQVREELLSLLLDRIDEDTYPSSTMMDLAESIMRPDEVPAYAEILLSKMRQDHVPSLDMMNRVLALA